MYFYDWFYNRVRRDLKSEHINEIMILVRFLLPGRKEHSEYPWTTLFLPHPPPLQINHHITEIYEKRFTILINCCFIIWMDIGPSLQMLLCYDFFQSTNFFSFPLFLVCFIDVVCNWIQFIVIEFTFIFFNFYPHFFFLEFWNK